MFYLFNNSITSTTIKSKIKMYFPIKKKTVLHISNARLLRVKNIVMNLLINNDAYLVFE